MARRADAPCDCMTRNAAARPARPVALPIPYARLMIFPGCFFGETAASRRIVIVATNPDYVPMIIDCHAHVFQSWEGACGHPSSEIHRRYIQKVQTRTNARVYRARDGKQFSGQLLFEEGKNGWSGLKDVNFRVGNWGRLDFT